MKIEKYTNDWLLLVPRAEGPSIEARRAEERGPKVRERGGVLGEGAASPLPTS